MRVVQVALFCLAATGCSAVAPEMASPPCPGPAIVDMRNRFEAAVLSMESKYADDPGGLRDAAMPVALSIYGADWGVVRAQAECSLASLPEADLSAYASATPTPSPFTDDIGAGMQDIMPFMNPAALAMSRFWDAETVGFMIAPMAAPLSLEDMSAAMIGTKIMLVPGRVSRGKFDTRDVLAARYMRSMVIIPYSITAQGMIMPAFDLVRVYPLQP